MKEFIYRTISKTYSITNEDGDKVVMDVSRTRNSNGHASIIASFGNNRIEFNIRDDYEQHARRFAEMILEVCDNPCKMPNVE